MAAGCEGVTERFGPFDRLLTRPTVQRVMMNKPQLTEGGLWETCLLSAAACWVVAIICQ